MSEKQKRYLLDLGERILWTALQAASAEGIVSFFQLDATLVIPIAAALALLKGVAGKYIGSPSTASTLPASVDTPAPLLLPAAKVDPLDKLE